MRECNRVVQHIEQEKEIAIREYLKKTFEVTDIIPIEQVPYGEYIQAYVKRETQNPRKSLKNANSGRKVYFQ